MREDGFWRVLIRYIRDHGLTIAAFAVLFSIFFFTCLLYQLPLDAVLYAALLTLVVGLLFLLQDFGGYRRKHRLLRELTGEVAVSLERLPEPAGLEEGDYQALIRVLFEEKARVISQADDARTEAADYYTLWAHQIKTPLAAMKLLIQAEPEEERRSQLVEELFKTEQYVEMVLQFLRLESLAADLVLRPCSLGDMVRQVLRKYSVLFIHRGLSVELGDLEATVVTDEKWFSFLLEQLVSNAVKYTRAGGVHIYLQPGARHLLVLEDTGVGISPEDLPRIFERGFTGYNGRMDKKATGIGLYLVSKIARRLGHSVSITSVQGRGTRVLVNLAREKLEIE